MRTYGLIGKTLQHSFSKNYFTEKFQKTGSDESYENIELAKISEVDKILKSGYSGLNVTIPYKESIIPFLDEIDDEAMQIGAVNTVCFKAGKSIGRNTDAAGFHQSIKPFLSRDHERAIVLGTGGAAKAVAYVLENLGIDVLYISRNPSEENEFGYHDINSYMLDACKMIVNTTPVGTYPNVDDIIPFPYTSLTDKHLVVDLIYNPERTRFLQESEAQGAMILNGYPMLVHQAEKAYELWTSER